MKIKLSVLLFSVLFLLLFSACRKCTTCIAYNRIDNTAIDMEKYCGSAPDVDESEKNFETVKNNTQNYVVCEEEKD